MKNLKDIIIEKLKVSANTESVSFTFNELFDSIIQFVNENISKNSVLRIKSEYVVKLYYLDYFEDNPLIIKDETPLKSMFRLQGCKTGTMFVNTKYPDRITCFTSGRSMTLKDNGSVDQSFEITEENFNKVFDNSELEKLYSILNNDA